MYRQILAKFVKITQGGLRVVSGWSQGGLRVVSGWSQSGRRVVSGWQSLTCLSAQFTRPSTTVQCLMAINGCLIDLITLVNDIDVDGLVQQMDVICCKKWTSYCLIWGVLSICYFLNHFEQKQAKAKVMQKWHFGLSTIPCFHK